MQATLPFVALMTALLAACASGESSPPSHSPALPDPTPTPIGGTVETPSDAAALVIATDPRFAGTPPLNPDMIGANRWWEAEPLDGGGYRIKLTIGWGDCPAGCINKHVWAFDVTADGQVRLLEESGDPIPPGGVPSGDS